ncbi:hypothetical protein SynA1544_01797 [Synechococcus sp. A15-44]|nr:hypothetical protein SynA1544_01797 [Synechococcus sp. A15-44]
MTQPITKAFNRVQFLFIHDAELQTRSLAVSGDHPGHP